MRSPLHVITLKAAISIGLLLAATAIANAQAMTTADRSGEITPFAQATFIRPDWGQTTNLGYTFGVDFTRFIRSSLLQPSLELRMNSAGGRTVLERSYLGGFKLGATIHRIHPFATILGGEGSISFTHPGGGYLGDRSFVLSAGAGAEFYVAPALTARFDFTEQFWNIDPQTLTPMTFGIGLAYHIGERNHRAR